MSLGLVGRKIGMTRVFTEDGASVPVTVLDVSDNRVTQIKTFATDGYSAVQVTCGTRRAHRISKPLVSHFAKAGVEAGRALKEFTASSDEIGDLKLGDTLTLERFQVGQKVDVSGTSQGKGFSGVIKRHNFSSNRASHGNSITTRAPGSIGQAQDPGRVFPGKKMAGHYGAAKTTTQNLEIVRIDTERHLLLIKGAIPGSKGNDVIVRPSVKAGA
ncbi:MAG TPA: 50S ribosomal protein L3 [Betaproteobacteria bacterium]|nr:50S ribosomal protein L3 [Betaproteobacteria bacterium]